jgi:prophage antirepressor-like protein
MSAALSFGGVTFSVMDCHGAPWLQGSEIARALGYAKADVVSRIYQRHAAEFDDGMTCMVNLTVPGDVLMIPVRIFSLRGAHLLAMLACTPKAADFRRWVLDLLEGLTHGGASLLARLDAAERAEAQSFAAAHRGSLAMLKRKREKRRLLAAVVQAREAVQMNLPFEGNAAA